MRKYQIPIKYEVRNRKKTEIAEAQDIVGSEIK